VRRRYMLDTDICIYLAKDRYPQVTARFERLQADQPVMSVITYGELHHGANKSADRSRSLSYLAELIQEIPVEGLTASAAEVYGRIRATLQKQGRVIGSNDIWIAAHALSLDVTLATNNKREFLRATGLSVENWTK
jgi:tRNA(fMet)-specific endonuclease VapC